MEDLDFSDLLDSIELTFTRYNTFKTVQQSAKDKEDI